MCHIEKDFSSGENRQNSITKLIMNIFIKKNICIYLRSILLTEENEIDGN